LTPLAFIYSAVSGLEAAAAYLFAGTDKAAEERGHQLIFEALAARAGRFDRPVAAAVRRQVLAAIGARATDGAAMDTARGAFDSVLEPVLIEVLRSLLRASLPARHRATVERIVVEEEHHSGGPCGSDEVYQAALRGAVKTLTCPFFARPLSALLGPETSALGLRVREIFRQARAAKGPDPARIFGLCPIMRGATAPLPMNDWTRQRVRGRFLSPMLQVLRVPVAGSPSPRAVEAAVAKAAAELVAEPRFNAVRVGHEMFALIDPAIVVRRMSDGQSLVNVPLPAHGAAEMKVDGFARRIARRERVLRKSRAGWWDPSANDGLPMAELHAIPTVSGVAATVSSLAHQPGPEWHGFAAPEESEGATYNVLVTGYAPGSGFSLSVACDHRSIDGHVMGEFGIALAARAGALLG